VSLPAWTERPLAAHHDRKAFDCGEAALNEFLARHARKNHESGGAKTFVASPRGEPGRVLGYYTLAPASFALARAPVFRLGRLAVDRSVQGQGLGGQLLLAAGRRCLAVAEEVGGVALLIDAKSERAAAWYQSYGAVALEDAPLSLVQPLATIAAAIR
jgi:GNAT superfamily N-acetyltransferase